MSTRKQVLAWLCVLPAAIGAAALVMLGASVRYQIHGEDDWFWVLLNAGTPWAFVHTGGRVAPRFKLATASVLAALCIALGLMCIAIRLQGLGVYSIEKMSTYWFTMTLLGHFAGTGAGLYTVCQADETNPV